MLCTKTLLKVVFKAILLKIFLEDTIMKNIFDKHSWQKTIL